MTKATKDQTQARLRKEECERHAKMAKQKANRLAVEGDRKKLEALGREIEVRVGKLNQLGGKAVDMLELDQPPARRCRKALRSGRALLRRFQKDPLPRAGAVPHLRDARRPGRA